MALADDNPAPEPTTPRRALDALATRATATRWAARLFDRDTVALDPTIRMSPTRSPSGSAGWTRRPTSRCRPPALEGFGDGAVDAGFTPPS